MSTLVSNFSYVRVRHLVAPALIAVAALIAIPAPARADAALDGATQKVVKALVGAIRYEKDDVASKQLAYTAMAHGLLGDDWGKLSSAEQTEFVGGLETLIRAISFVQGREMFRYLDAMLYKPTQADGEMARSKSTIVVHRDLKKAEIPVEWVLAKEGGTWKVFDVVMMGDSIMSGLRDDQIKPLLKEGGVPALMKAMRDKVAEVRKPKKP